MNIFNRLFNYLNSWSEHRKVIKQLNQMSNRELSDIGINRADINRLIWLDEDRKDRGQ